VKYPTAFLTNSGDGPIFFEPPDINNYMIWGGLPCYDRYRADVSRGPSSTTGER